MNSISDFADTILAVIRGEIPPSRLLEVGVQIVHRRGASELKSKASEVTVSPSISDLARGLLAHSASPDTLKTWAFFVLADSGSVDLANVESHPLGELLIDTLWDISVEGKIDQNAIRLAQSLIQ